MGSYSKIDRYASGPEASDFVYLLLWGLPSTLTVKY